MKQNKFSNYKDYCRSYYEKHHGSCVKKFLGNIIPIILISCILITTLCGCSQTGDPSSTTGSPKSESLADNTEGTGKSAEIAKTENGNSPGNAAMGRYVETVIDLKEYGASGHDERLSLMPDGQLLVLDNNSSAIGSRDHGDTWETMSYSWQKKFKENETFILSYAVAPDGTSAVIYDRFAETPKKSEEGLEFDPGLAIIKPDGTQIPVDLPLSDNESYPTNVWISNDNRIFVNALGGRNLYEVHEDGSCEKYLSLTGHSPDLVQFCGSFMVIGGDGYDGLLLYDMNKEEYVEDDILNDFVKETFGNSGLASGSQSYIYYFFPGEDKVLYLAGKKGVFRHVLGGSAIEQIIDGSLCSFGNPACELYGVEALPDNAFAALFGDGRFIRYTYDPNVPTAPGARIKAYSLKDNSLLRTAISQYQGDNPDIYVEYEVGMENSSATTKDDALKKLNTQIMAGEGPDLLILDDMPIDSYVEKGLLADLSGWADSLTGEEALSTSIVNALRKKFSNEGKVFTLPCSIEIPVITCRKKYTPMLTDLSGIADAIELMREDLPGYDLAGTISEKGIMKLFTPVCAPSWSTAQNTLDREQLSDFLTQTKRIYDAQMNGIDEEYKEYYDRLSKIFLAESGMTLEDSEYFGTGMDVMDLILRRRAAAVGTIGNIFHYSMAVSLPRTDGYSDFETVSLPGQCNHVFIASSLAGISAATQYPDEAEALLKVLLGKDISAVSEILPVSQAALEEIFTPNPDFFISYDKPYTYLAISDESGKMVNLDVYFPNEDEQDILRNYVQNAEVPYIRNKELEDAVYLQGTYFMQGKISLEEALREIEKAVSLQMAE